MERKYGTKILPRKFEPAVPGNVKLKLPNLSGEGRMAIEKIQLWAYFRNIKQGED
jgi:hypothetical protein